MEGATILIVDDDAEIRTLLAEFLESEGFRPIEAADGREAIALLDRSRPPPDLMLLDLIMPEVDGYAVLEHLREHLLQEFPVLVISAQRPDVSLLQALDAELRDFIAKPFQLDELLIRMHQLFLRSPRGQRESDEQLRIFTLGSFRVYCGEMLLFDEAWRHKPAKTIFKVLFTHRGRQYPKEELGELLWPEIDPDLVDNRLRVAVHALRKKLTRGRAEWGATTCIAQQEGRYYFDPCLPHWGDVEMFESLIGEGDRLRRVEQVDEALHAYAQAEVLYAGEYLRDDAYADWVMPTRERLREQHVAMLSTAAEIYAGKGCLDEAIGFCRKILAVEPWREEVYRGLMTYLAMAGKTDEALMVYERCRRTLERELQVTPSPETDTVRDQIRGGRMARAGVQASKKER